MDDKELLELAAKAAGEEVMWEFWDATDHACWNPLLDDGDAFRLAIDLCLLIDVTTLDVRVMTFDARIFQRAPHRDDKAKTTRRCIVLAAAEIGKTL